jgi:hypothetical protein
MAEALGAQRRRGGMHKQKIISNFNIVKGLLDFGRRR